MPSSVVRSYCYDAETAELLINFESGRSYTYQDVPRGVASGLRCAASKGVYFNRHIRDKFSFVRNADSRWALRSTPARIGQATPAA
jgi:lysyl-tRNA synthetase class 2